MKFKKNRKVLFITIFGILLSTSKIISASSTFPQVSVFDVKQEKIHRTHFLNLRFKELHYRDSSILPHNL